jgi:uncharacterized protein involved in outer membrane biogenesis
MKKAFKWLLLCIVILTASIMLLLFNPRLVKGPLENQLSDLTGYPVSLAGELDIDVGGITELSLTELHIRAPEWSGNPDLAVVGHLQLRLDLTSLFSDTIILESLYIDGVQVNLETDREGVQNWVTRQRAEQQTGGEQQPDGNQATVVVLNDLRLHNATLSHLDQVRDFKHLLHLSTLTQKHLPDGMLAVYLEGIFNDRPVGFDASFGPYVNLLQGRDVTFRGRGRFGNININGNGHIDELAKPRRPRFELSMQGPDTDTLTSMLGIKDLGTGDFVLNAHGHEVTDRYEAELNGEIGDVSMNLALTADQLFGLDELDLDLAADGPDLGALMDLFGVHGWPEESFSLDGKAQRIGSTFDIPGLNLSIGATRVQLDALLTNFPDLDAGRARLYASGDDISQVHQMLGIDGVATGSFELRGKLDVSPEQIESVLVELDTSLGNLTLSGTLGSISGFGGSDLQLRIDGRNAHEMMTIFKIHVLPELPFVLDAGVQITDEGVFLDKGVLRLDQEGRLNIHGFISFAPGGIGSDIEVSTRGQNLAGVLHRLVDETSIPAEPFDISARVRLLTKGIQLDNVQAKIAGVSLAGSGLLVPRYGFAGTRVNVQIDGADISALRRFSILDEPLKLLVAGQPFQVSTQFDIAQAGWRLNGVTGRIGDTGFNIDALVSQSPDWSGSFIDFSVNGPRLDKLLVDRYQVELPEGRFQSSGRLSLSSDVLDVDNFIFESPRANARIDLRFGWPVTDSVDATFNLDVSGQDVSLLLPPVDGFEPARTSFHLKAVGSKQNNRITLESIDSQIGDLRLLVKDRVDGASDDENVHLAINVTSPDLSSLGLFNDKQLPAMAADLQADLIGNPHQFKLENIRVRLDDSDISGILEISLEGTKPVTNLVLDSHTLDIRAFMNPPDSNTPEDAGVKKKRLIPETALPLDLLELTDATVSLGVDELILGASSLEDLVFKARVNDGSLEVSDLSFRELRGRLKSSLSVVPVGAGKANVAIDVVGNNVFLDLFETPEDEWSTLPVYDIDLQVNGTGGTTRELAGSLDGRLFIGSGGGTLKDVNLSLLDTFILEEVFALITPKSTKSDALNIACFVSVFEFKNGVVKTQPVVALTTDKINLISKGTLDLKTENISFNFNATPNKALNISPSELLNPYILVGGTLAEPDVGIDPSKALIHGGAAIGTAGISILAKGVLDRVGVTVPTCEEILEQEKSG